MKLLPFSRYKVEGSSMFPTLRDGSELVCFNWAYIGRKPEIGEVIILNYQGRELVKRVTKIEDEQIFVEGDNKKNSTDSRDFGFLSSENIKGMVVYKNSDIDGAVFGYNEIPCPKCAAPVLEIYGRKDAICSNCGFKLTCCGEP